MFLTYIIIQTDRTRVWIILLKNYEDHQLNTFMGEEEQEAQNEIDFTKSSHSQRGI